MAIHIVEPENGIEVMAGMRDLGPRLRDDDRREIALLQESGTVDDHLSYTAGASWKALFFEDDAGTILGAAGCAPSARYELPNGDIAMVSSIWFVSDPKLWTPANTLGFIRVAKDALDRLFRSLPEYEVFGNYVWSKHEKSPRLIRWLGGVLTTRPIKMGPFGEGFHYFGFKNPYNHLTK